MTLSITTLTVMVSRITIPIIVTVNITTLSIAKVGITIHSA
jgi:hypothetical protein